MACDSKGRGTTLVTAFRKKDRRVRLHVAGLVTGTLLLLSLEALGAISARLAEQGWAEYTFSDLKPNQWEATDSGIRVRTDGSVSVLYRNLSTDLSKTPVLAWRWRVSNAPLASDLSHDSGEDRAIALTVGFPYEPKRATFLQALTRSFVVAQQGPTRPAEA